MRPPISGGATRILSRISSPTARLIAEPPVAVRSKCLRPSSRSNSRSLIVDCRSRRSSMISVNTEVSGQARWPISFTDPPILINILMAENTWAQPALDFPSQASNSLQILSARLGCRSRGCSNSKNLEDKRCSAPIRLPNNNELYCRKSHCGDITSSAKLEALRLRHHQIELSAQNQSCPWTPHSTSSHDAPPSDFGPAR